MRGKGSNNDEINKKKYTWKNLPRDIVEESFREKHRSVQLDKQCKCWVWETQIQARRIFVDLLTRNNCFVKKLEKVKKHIWILLDTNN